MKRVATWLLYFVGGLSIAYLAFHAYAMMHPAPTGAPIKIFRKDNAPDYS